MDEPFTGLDTETRQRVIQYILKNRRGRILLVATHGEDDAAMLGAQIIRLEECQEVEEKQMEKEQAAQKRQMKIHQIMEIMKNLSTEQMAELLSQASDMMEMEKVKGRNLYPFVKKLQLQQGNIAIMKDIPKDQWNQVLSALGGWEQHYEAGKVIWNVGDIVKELPIILEGSVEAYTIHEKAKESLVSRFTEGHCFGEMLAIKGVPSPVQVRACEEVTVMYLPVDQLKNSGCESREDIQRMISWKLLEEMADKLYIITNKLGLNGNIVIRSVLDYLNSLPEEGPDKRVKVKQKDMAMYLNISRETVSRAIARLEKEKVIKRNEDGSICVLIPDWEAPEEQEETEK